jgi:hypothetical protein
LDACWAFEKPARVDVAATCASRVFQGFFWGKRIYFRSILIDMAVTAQFFRLHVILTLKKYKEDLWIVNKIFTLFSKSLKR